MKRYEVRLLRTAVTAARLLRLGGVLACAAAGAATGADLLRGAIDLHCHPGPDVLARSANDLEFARAARAAGLRAIVFKNHYTETAARARLAMQAVDGIEVFGGIVLNRAVGGLNAEAVRRMAEMEGRRGRIVWLPTFDALNAIGQAGEVRPAVAVASAGRPVPELQEVFATVARHGLVLATGHSSAKESLALIAAARGAGIRHVVVTHALFPPLGATLDDLAAMAALGATLEFSWLMHVPAAPGATGGRAVPTVPLSRCVDAIRRIGARQVVLSSDFGQAVNPLPPEGLGAFVTALLAEGITRGEIDLMVRTNPARILGLDP